MSDVLAIKPVEVALADFGPTMTVTLDNLLPKPKGRESKLFRAMRYSVLANSKFLRPYLLRTSALMFGVPEAAYLRAGAAVEMVHTYSLIHDDLPAMDDDGIRRGRPSRVFFFLFHQDVKFGTKFSIISMFSNQTFCGTK